MTVSPDNGIPSESWKFIIIMYHLEFTPKSYELLFKLSSSYFIDSKTLLTTPLKRRLKDIEEI
jgi:hypothetical protein